MKVTCEACKTPYNIADDKVPAQKAKATCSKCGGDIIIDPFAARATSTAEVPAEITAAFPELAGPQFTACELSEIITPDKKGRYQNSKNKLKMKILSTVAPKFAQMLADGEKVHRIGYGVAYHPFEVIFGNGYFTMLSNYYAIAATDRRLLFININSRMTKTTHIVFQLPYDHIKKASFGTLFSRIVLTPVKGKRRTFTHMKRYMLKELKEYIQSRQSVATPVAAAGAQPFDMCPACYVPVVQGAAECPSCAAGFKRPFAAFWRSLLLPGLGDIYLGHKVLGTLELFGSLIVWAVIIMMLMSGEVENIIVAGFILTIVNVTDGILTYFMGRKGYILA